MVLEDSFPLPHARRQYGASRVVDILHIDLSLRPDLDRQTLHGVCTLRARAIDAAVIRLDLDAVDLAIDEVADAHGTLPFAQRNGTLAIDLRAPLQRTDDTAFTIRYRVEAARRGLFFIAPSEADPDAPVQCWTHGHAGTARHWFPCIDDPQQRQTSTTTIEVARGLFALSNGELVARHDVASTNTTVFAYAQRKPHASYLFTMVVGHFTEVAQLAGAIPVFAYVTPGREADAQRTFGQAPEMLAALERFSGTAYPYDRYSQIAVAHFAFIGMENTSASTFTDEWLLEERVLASPEVESLVVHELAHQWFGNLISSPQWTDAWLNEGFASYAEAVWEEAQSGWEGYLYNVFCQVRTYLTEAQRYTRPIICDYFRDPIDLFDKHLYEKASAVLHMLRGELGEARFARAVARYVRDNAGGAVETIDFIRAIENATGRNMRAFFDQWARRGGHPIVTAAVNYDADRRQLRLRFTQRQRIDDAHPAYRFNMAVGILDALPDSPPEPAGPAPLRGERRVNVRIDAPSTTYTIDVERAPALIRIDPGAWTLGEIALELTPDIGCAALAHDPDPTARIRAARAVAADGGAQARKALMTAMTHDRFWGARVEFATILSEAQAPWARDVLLAAIADPHAAVRRSVCAALGNYRGEAVAATLRAVIDTERAFEVVAEALHALGRTRAPEAESVLVGALSDRSWRDVVGGGALLGLAALAAPSATATLLAALTAALPGRRQSALRALPTLAEHRPLERSVIIQAAIDALADPIAMTRLRAIQALDHLLDSSAILPLERLAIREPIAWVRSHADRAAQRIRSHLSPAGYPAAIGAERHTLQSHDDGATATPFAQTATPYAATVDAIQSPTADPPPQPARPPA